MGSVERRGLGLGMHVENVVASPRSGIRVILDGLQIPFRASGHRIYGNTAQKTDFAIGPGTNLDALYKCFQVRGVSLAAHLHANQIAVCVVLIVIDSIADLAQRLMKLGFLGPDDSSAHNR